MNQTRSRSERGQSIVEFALVTPILLLMLLGLAEFGFALNNQVAIANASRNGARVAALNNGSASLVRTAVQDSANSLIACTLASSPVISSTTTTPTTTTPTTTTPVQTTSWTVQASCKYTSLTGLASFLYTNPYFKLGDGTGYTISVSNTMRDVNCTPQSTPPCPYP